MKRIFTAILAMCMILCAGCGNTTDGTTAPSQTASSTEPSVSSAVNEGALQMGVYGGSATYAEGEFSKTWNFTISFHEDGSFVLTDDAGEEKGAGTWALNGEQYTMTYSDDRTAAFVILADGTLNVVTDLPFGKHGISPDMVGGIALTYLGEAMTESGAFLLRAGTYTASYTKESPMAGTVTYVYTAEIGEDGSFSYRVSFQMGEENYEGSAATGRYTLENGVFTFTDDQGNVIEGTVTEENTLTISLMASAMAKEPYEVTFVPAA